MFEIRQRSPRQERAERTVSALLTAASQILARGASSGPAPPRLPNGRASAFSSLYQYFGNKEELLVALAKREVSQILATVAAEFAVSPPGRRGRGIVGGIVAAIGGRWSGNRANLQLLLRYAGRAEILSQGRFRNGFSALLAGDRRLGPEEIFVLPCHDRVAVAARPKSIHPT